MTEVKTDIVIIGAGLTGLTLAYYLHRAGIPYAIVEAESRVGGRIFTRTENGNAPVELGATWFGKQHTALFELLKELGLAYFEQELSGQAIYEPISTSPAQLVSLPPNEAPSYRIKDGTSALIEALLLKLHPDSVYVGQKIDSISCAENACVINSKDYSYSANKVISTLPPNLLANSIDISPSLSASISTVMRETHTWMGESIKIALCYERPFWKSSKTSGTLFSNVGPVTELYDHSNFEGSKYALKGFFNPSYSSLSKQERLNLLMAQLEKYYGPQVRDFKSYEEMVWKDAPLTYHAYQNEVVPHQNNGHPLFQEIWHNGRLILAGSETASQFPGYMDGAIRSAQFAFSKIMDA